MCLKLDSISSSESIIIHEHINKKQNNVEPCNNLRFTDEHELSSEV